MKNICTKFLFCFFFLIISLDTLIAQQYPITNYTKDRGLPGNQVWSIYQDDKGYMWFCTSSGLIKYNGKSYKIFGSEEGLLDNIPLGITGDEKGNLWIAYDKGISRISNGKIKNWKLKESEGQFTLFKDSYNRIWVHSLFFPGDVLYFLDTTVVNFSKQHSFKNQVIVSITEDKTGGILFITRDGKIFRYFADQIKELLINNLDDSRVRYSFFDDKNNLIVCTENGLGLILGEQLENNPPINWLLNVPANYGMQSKNGCYWFATENGIYRYKNINNKFSNIINITENNGLRSNIIFRLFEDFEGNLWIGHSEKGISKISSLMFTTYGKEEGLISDAILAISKSNDKYIIAADKGLFKFNGQRFEFINVSSPFSKRWYFTILPYSNSELFLGSTPGMVSLLDLSSYKIIGLDKKIIFTTLKDHLGNVWVGTNTGVYLKAGQEFIEQDFGVSGIEIDKLLEVRNKDLYIGTTDGLVIVENGTIPFSSKNIVKAKEIKVPLLPIKDMIGDKDGEILLAIGKELLIIDKQKKIKSIDALKNSDIIVLHIDSNQRLWAGSNASGLFMLQKVNGKYEILSHYTYSDGISSNEFAYNNSITEGTDGKIYFGMFDGLTVYNPAEDRVITAAPYSYITGVKVNDSTYSISDISGIELAPSQNKISFYCDGLSFYNENAVKFQYYLQGIEKEWSNVSTNPEVTYGYLESGNYTFLMRAVNQFGVASQPQSISFTILAPVWKRPWFISISILILLFLAYNAYKYRLSHIRKRNLQLEKIVEEKTTDLQKSKVQIEEQYNRLVDAQKELVEKRELEKAHKEIQLLKNRLEKENIYLREKQGNVQELSSIIGRSHAINEIRRKIQQIAETDSTVLITGETGVGKNLIAEAIHNTSMRKERALVVVNCAAIPDALVESELFGHEKGAFTGADKLHIGKFEVADGSTIFLDEIGDMNLNVQAKVLNVVQSKKITRIGGSQELNVDVRIIAATNHNLEERVKEGKFRQDLFYRINVYPIYAPPLRECKDDIEYLSKYFVDRYSKSLNKKISAITKSALDILKSHSYPGNIRELENIIHRAVIISKMDVISDEDILLNLNTPFNNVEESFYDQLVTLEQMEKQYIIHILTKTGGKISGKNGAAELLGINPSTLRSRMKKLDINFIEHS
ncbi:MAG: sigma 54-interacting transcriptional regulator [Ignavibacterium sp.]|nr:sigma 54-interacting transcriptional regulator [Ignavibacterium sp.]